MKSHKLEKAIPLLDAVGVGVIRSGGEYIATDHRDPAAGFEAVSEFDFEALDALHARLMLVHRQRSIGQAERRARLGEAYAKREAYWIDSNRPEPPVPSPYDTLQ